MIKVYPAVIHREKNGYWLEYPDINGCYTEGDSLEELMQNAEEVLGTFLAVKMEYNEEIPNSSDIKDVICDNDSSKTYVAADVNKYHKDTRAVKKMLSIPAWLAKEAEAHNFSLSKVLQAALMEKLDLA